MAILEYEPGVVDTDMQVQVRNSGKENFPNIDRFIDLKNNNELVSAEDSAAQIWPFLEEKIGDAYQERRYSK